MSTTRNRRPVRDGTAAQQVGETGANGTPPTPSRQPTLTTALPVIFDGACLSDAERVELRHARTLQRRARQARARQRDSQTGGAR